LWSGAMLKGIYFRVASLALTATILACSASTVFAQQSSIASTFTGGLNSSQSSATTDFQNQVLSTANAVSSNAQGQPNGGAVFGADFPTGRLRETWHDGYDSLLSNHLPTYASQTTEASAIGSVFIAFPDAFWGGKLQLGALGGEDRLDTLFKRTPVSEPILPGTKASNTSSIAGSYAIYTSGTSYAMAMIVGFDGSTDQVGGRAIAGRSSYDTHGVVASEVAGHVFDLDRLCNMPLKFDARGGILYSRADGDSFSDPSGDILRPTVQSWTASLSGTLFSQWNLVGGETFRPYIKGELREQLAYDNKVVNLTPLLANITYRFNQADSMGVAEVGFDYAWSGVTFTGAVYGEKSSDQASVGGRLGAKFPLN
jgi:hypothetical protein